MTRETLEQRKREAVALIRKGGLSARIGLAFLKQHGTAWVRTSHPQRG